MLGLHARLSGNNRHLARSAPAPRIPSLRLALGGLALVAASAQADVGNWSSHGPDGGAVTRLAAYEAGPGTLWAAGRGGVFRNIGGGAWSRIEVGLPDSLFSIDLVAATAAPVLYLAGQTRLYRSANGGDLWVTSSFVPPANHFIQDIAIRRATSNSIAVVTNHGAFVSSDGGSVFVGPGGLDAAVEYAAIEYAADGTLYLGIAYDQASTYPSALLKSTTGGASWTATALAPGNVRSIVSAPTAAARLYVSDGSSVQTSATAGSAWANVPLPPAGCGQVLGMTVEPANPLGLVIGCSRLGLASTTNATAAPPTWVVRGSAGGFGINGTGDPAQAVSIALHPGYPGVGQIWAGNEFGGFLSSSTGGSSWVPLNLGFQSSNIRAIAAHPLDSNVLLAGFGDANTTSPGIYRTVDAGANWNTANSALNAENIRAIAIDPTTVDADPFSSENFTVYAVGRSERIPDAANKDGGIYKSTDRGSSWSSIDSGIPLNPLVTGRPDMGTVRGVYLDRRSCASPPPSGPCPPGSGPLQKLLVVGGGRPDFSGPGLPYRAARIYRSSNAGASWTASEAGLPLPQDLGGGALGFTAGIVPIVADPTDGNILYVGSFLGTTAPTGGPVPTIANGVFRSTDGGLNWTHRSNGLPRVAGAGTSQLDVLSLAISPANPLVLYASTINFLDPSAPSRVFKTTDAGANWFEQSAGIAGQDVRALLVDPNDPSGNTVYAATGGGSSDPGGVYRTTDGGLSWNSYSLGLPANSATALALPPRATGAPARIYAGTSSGVWDFTEAPDPDADGAPTAIELQVAGGDGNNDGSADAGQRGVASLLTQASGRGTQISLTTALVSGCSQLNNSANLDAGLYPPDPLGNASSHAPWGLLRIELPSCTAGVVDVIFHGANFASGNWIWRNYGPRRPGDDGSFGWYTFAGARRLSATTWRLDIAALRQGNYRADGNNILFIGGPADLPDVIFSNGYE